MDLSTLAGLLLGFIILVSALILGQVPVTTLLNPEAILIVFGGTMTATLVSFNMASLGRSLVAMRRCLRRQQAVQPSECIDYILEVAAFIRAEGILAMQPLLDSVEIPFLRKGLGYVLDNRSERFIREGLTTEIEVAHREALEHARVFEAAGGFAPTMGIIGAVIGLIYVVQSFHDPERLGQGVASAFSATLYGVALSNLFLLPLAAKLRQQAREEWFQKIILLEGILSVRAGEHPMILEQKLDAFIIRQDSLTRMPTRAPQNRDDVFEEDFGPMPLGV